MIMHLPNAPVAATARLDPSCALGWGSPTGGPTLAAIGKRTATQAHSIAAASFATPTRPVKSAGVWTPRRRRRLRIHDRSFPQHESSAERALPHWLADLRTTARAGPITGADKQTAFERREAGWRTRSGCARTSDNWLPSCMCADVAVH